MYRHACAALVHETNYNCHLALIAKLFSVSLLQEASSVMDVDREYHRVVSLTSLKTVCSQLLIFRLFLLCDILGFFLCWFLFYLVGHKINMHCERWSFFSVSSSKQQKFQSFDRSIVTPFTKRSLSDHLSVSGNTSQLLLFLLFFFLHQRSTARCRLLII